MRVCGLLRLAAVGGLLALAGCQTDPNEEAAQCPRAFLLPDAASLVHYNGAGHDIAQIDYSAKLTDIKGLCAGRIGTQRQTAHVHVVMLVTRGAASRSDSVDIPYSVGVIRNGVIMDEAHFVQHVTFPQNVDTVEVTGQEIPFSLPTRRGVSAQTYSMYFWLQLTPEELARNRARG